MLRLEINIFNQYRQQLMYVSGVIIVAVVAAAATVAGGALQAQGTPEGQQFLSSLLSKIEKFSGKYWLICIVLSLLFSLGGLLFAELRLRIYRVATYVDNELRPLIIQVCPGFNLLDWEGFILKRDPYRKMRYWIVEDIGWLMFICPALVSGAFGASQLWRTVSPSYWKLGGIILLVATGPLYTTYVFWRLPRERSKSREEAEKVLQSKSLEPPPPIVNPGPSVPWVIRWPKTRRKSHP